METQLANRNAVRIPDELAEIVLVGGDLAVLNAAQRVAYVRAVCQSLGLNELTRPLEYIKLNNKLTLYARKDCTDQLRARDKISIIEIGAQIVEGVYMVTAKAQGADGKVDVATGGVSIKGLVGENLANAMMKAETKAKRRVTLSICGLGWLDESEVDPDEDGNARTATITPTIKPPQSKSAPSSPPPPLDVDGNLIPPADDPPPPSEGEWGEPQAYTGPVDPEPTAPPAAMTPEPGDVVATVTVTGVWTAGRDGTPLMSKRGPYTNLRVQGNQGEIDAKYWKAAPPWLVKGAKIKIRGKMGEYQGKPQLTIAHMEAANGK